MSIFRPTDYHFAISYRYLPISNILADINNFLFLGYDKGEVSLAILQPWKAPVCSRLLRNEDKHSTHKIKGKTML